MANEDQLEEMEALRSIFDADLTGPVSLKLTFSVNYPNECPKIELPMRSRVISSEQVDQLLSLLHTCAEENLGMPMVYTLADFAQQWINDNVTSTVPVDEDQDPKLPWSVYDVNVDLKPWVSLNRTREIKDMETLDQNEMSLLNQTVNIKLEEPKANGGRWDYVIGLVGKPSAGKSTFFNAATAHDIAKIGSHPFTTIEPNIGKAFYSVPCPCHARLHTLCNAAYGHDIKGDRYIPVLLKDVAGLVPGAWEGKGRGNRFLNDLLDADVLIHIIDVSGTTNEKGEETQDYDPANDIHWLHQELHQWIYQNVHSRWDSIQKRPSKLVDMFTGYHANKTTIHTALQNAGVGDKEMSAIKTWEDAVLHRIVSCFLQLRFPMLLVLNKADKKMSASNIQRLKDEMPNANMIPVCSKTECKLQKLKRDGLISYELGSDKVEVVESSAATDVVKTQIRDIALNIMDRFQSTNVHNALGQAVKLRPPTYAFPVRCLDTLKSVRKAAGRENDTFLRDCILLKQGTTVEEFYNVLCHYPVGLLSGDFVRAETANEIGEKRPVRKDECISYSNNILKIMTTKRSSS